MLDSGTDPESYDAEYTSVYEENYESRLSQVELVTPRPHTLVYEDKDGFSR